MENYKDYLSLGATTIIAIWNIIMQFQIKKIEKRQSERHIKLHKTTEHEYETYKNIWNLVAEILEKTKHLRLKPKTDHAFDTFPEFSITKEKLDEYLINVSSLENRLMSNSPFITVEISQAIQNIINIARLEYLQACSSRLSSGIDLNAMGQAENNLSQIKIAFKSAEELLRKRILE